MFEADVALLTPVPEHHLISAEKLCQTTGFVTFGTGAIETLSKFDNLIGKDSRATVLIYASMSTISGVPKVSYTARFEKFVGAKSDGTAPDDFSKYRPPSTFGDGKWQSFYVVSNLTKLANPIDIKTLNKHRAKGTFKADFIPQGPIIIANPF